MPNATATDQVNGPSIARLTGTGVNGIESEAGAASHRAPLNNGTINDPASSDLPPQHHNSHMLPPKAAAPASYKKRSIVRRKVVVQRGPRQWDDGFAATKSAIPAYHAYADPHSAGYMGQLKKNGQYTKYLRNVAL